MGRQWIASQGRAVGAALILTHLIGGVTFGQGAGVPFRHDNHPDNLKALFQAIHRARTANDTRSAAELVRSVLPDEARIRAGLRNGVPDDVVARFVALHKSWPSDTDAAAADLFTMRPDQTEVHVSGATTEELQAYAHGSMAFNEFPGGTQGLAHTVLRPGMRYYEVALVAPGKPRGMKFHFFFWDGSRWTMLGPVWRALR